jgi:hypothetical protein
MNKRRDRVGLDLALVVVMSPHDDTDDVFYDEGQSYGSFQTRIYARIQFFKKTK